MKNRIDDIIWILENYDGIIIRYKYYDMLKKENKYHITINDRTTNFLYAIIDVYTFEQMLNKEYIMFGCEIGPNIDAYILDKN